MERLAHGNGFVSRVTFRKLHASCRNFGSSEDEFLCDVYGFWVVINQATNGNGGTFCSSKSLMPLELTSARVDSYLSRAYSKMSAPSRKKIVKRNKIIYGK